VLFSCVGAYGHFFPLVPLARALARAQHQVAFASAESFGPEIAAAGFEPVPAGMADLDRRNAFRPFLEGILALPQAERRVATFVGGFARIAAPVTFPQLLPKARAWRPDIIVYETTELAAPIVAAALDVPSVDHGFGRLIPLAALAQASDVVAPLWIDAGLEPAAYAGAFQYLYIDPCPPSLQSESPPSGKVALIRPVGFDDAIDDGAAFSDWLDGLPDRPTIYVTLGTVFNDVQSFRLIVDALALLDANVIVTTGRDVDPADLGAWHANVRVEQYIPQSVVLPRIALVVTHGGSGSMLGALAHGRPMVLLPRGADQFDNAAAAVKAGVGVQLLPAEVTAEALRTAVSRVLDTRSYATAAQKLQAEIQAMPAPASAVEIIEALVDSAT
jgi:UDP:flavonoid glycosyltransferase YjiC (YdhE family)